MLTAQGLAGGNRVPAEKADVLEAIRQMGALQIDTISVVNRSPYFVLWSRLGAYEPSWLDELLAEGALFEFWAHAACFLPIEDYLLYRRRMLERSSRWSSRLLGEQGTLAESILSRIRAEGPLGSSDFEATERQPGGWWNWRDEKLVLEALFDTGELMIAKRRNFQRLYDLRERVLPAWDDTSAPPKVEADGALALKAVKALGVGTAAWVRDYFRTGAVATATQLEALARDDKLLRVRMEGLQDVAYVHPDNIDILHDDHGAAESPRTTLLSPFDPIVWDRRRARELFGFDYTIECYTPAAKRRYGYFCLPILWRERLVGRLDAKAHRKEGIFEVRNLHLEPDVEPSDELVADLAETLRDCAVWHRTPVIAVNRSEPAMLAVELNRLLAD